MRELTWALFPGEELFAPAATLRSESLGSSSVYSKVCHTRITRLEASGLGFGDVVVAGVWGRAPARSLRGPRSKFAGYCEAILLQRGVFFHKRASVSKFYFRCFQNATGSSSGPCKVPELRIELAVPVFHAEGR